MARGRKAKASSALRVRLLGPFQVWRVGLLRQPRDWIDRKVQALFKILVAERGRTYSRDELLEFLWPDLSPKQGLNNLHVRVSQLRQLLEPRLRRGQGRKSAYILTIHEGYRFNPETDCWVDTEAFAHRCQRAEALQAQGRFAETIEAYEAALRLYRGDFLEEDRYEEWTIPHRERWRETLLLSLAQLAECHARLGQYARALKRCRRVLELEPLRESVYCQKMLYHFLAGERSEALQTYQACARLLKEQLQVEPASETFTLYGQILKGEIPGVKGVYPLPFSPAPARHNLPQQLTSFIGRAREMLEVERLLSHSRLLTLTGVGGCGKTRLALQVVANLLAEYTNGVWWVDLAALSDPSRVPQTVASALGVREERSPPLMEALMNYLQSKHLLLVLDNCEHLIEACAQLVQALLSSCPNLRILVTSREALGFAGEVVWPVPPLLLPDPQRPLPLECFTQYDAICLFLERAVYSQSQFALTQQNASAVVQVCQRLDGLPLAIELAAGKLKALSVEQVAQRLDDRFQLLRGASRTALPRHQTLQAMMDWSFQLLSKAEQVLLRRLAVFAGGFSLEALEAVCPGEGLEEHEVVDLLMRLVDKSLVVVEERGGEVRYRLLETVRQYARGKLRGSGESKTLRDRHLDFFLRLGEEAEPKLRGAEQIPWLNQLKMEHDNLRAALEWSLEGRDTKAGLRLAKSLERFWEIHGHVSEGREWLARVLDRAEASKATALQAMTLIAASRLASLQDDLTAMSAFCEKSLRICQALGEKRGVADSLHYLGQVAFTQCDFVRARSLYEESLAIRQELGDKWDIASSLNNLGNVALYQRDLAQARSFYQESLAIRRELGDKAYIAGSLNNLGLVAFYQGDYMAARLLHEESLAILRELGANHGISQSLHNLAEVAKAQGDYERATALYRENLTLWWEVGNRNISYDLEGLATLASAQGQPERAARLFGAAESHREAMGTPLPPVDRAEYECSVVAVRAQLDEEAFQGAWAQGRTMTVEQALEYALKNE